LYLKDGMLPASELSGQYRLTDAYLADAVAVTAEQLQKAGVRLAFVLNRCLPRSDLWQAERFGRV
jgi:hypothetical protein